MKIKFNKSIQRITLVLLFFQAGFGFGQLKKFSGPYSINSSSGLFNSNGREIKGTATYYYNDGENYSKIYNGKFEFNGEMYVEDGLQVGYYDGFLGGNNTNDLLVFKDYFGSMKFDISGNFVQDEKHGKWVSNYYQTQADDYEKKSMKIIRNFENGFLMGEQSISYSFKRYNYEKRLSEYRHFVLKAEFSKSGPVNRLYYYDTVYYGNQSEKGYSHMYTANYDEAGKLDGVTEFTHNVDGVVYMDKRTFLHGLLLEYVQLNRNNGIVYMFGDAVKNFMAQLDEKFRLEVDSGNNELNQLNNDLKQYKELSDFVANIDKYNKVILSNAQIESRCRSLRDDYDNNVYDEVPYEIEFINSLVRNGLPLLFITIDPLALFGNYLPEDFAFLGSRNYDGDANEDVQSDRPDQAYFLELYEGKLKEINHIQFLEEEKKRVQDSIESDRIVKHDSTLCYELKRIYLMDTVEAYAMLKEFIDLNNCSLTSAVKANHEFKQAHDAFLKRRSDTLYHDKRILQIGLDRAQPWTMESLKNSIRLYLDSFYLEDFRVEFLADLTRLYGSSVLEIPVKDWVSYLQVVENQNCATMSSFSLVLNPLERVLTYQSFGTLIEDKTIKLPDYVNTDYSWIPESFSRFVNFGIEMEVLIDTVSFAAFIYKVNDQVGIVGCMPDSLVNKGYTMFLNEENGKYFIVEDIQDMRKSDLKRRVEIPILQAIDYLPSFEHSYFNGRQMKFVTTIRNDSIAYTKQYSTSTLVDAQRMTIYAVYTNATDFKSRKSEVLD